MEDLETLYLKTRDEWRSWLEEHHDTAERIWLIYYKKHTKKPTVAYNDAVEEALCFGWIDGQVKRIDDERYMQRYTPRRRRSNWSESNRKRVAKLIKEGKMTPVGMVKVDEAKEDGTWDPPATRDPQPPKEFLDALDRNKKAKEFFDGLAPSYKKHYLWWINDAKRSSTKKDRIEKVIKRLEEGKKPGML